MFLKPEEQGPKGGEKVLLPRRVDWLRGQRGLRELMVPTFPGGVTDCSSWVGLMNVGPTFVSGASLGLTSVEMSLSRQRRRRCWWQEVAAAASGPCTASQSYSSCNLLGLPIMR